MNVLAPVRSTFRAIAITVVPEAAALGRDEWAALEAIIEQALADRPSSMHRQLQVFIRVIDLVARVTRARAFAALGSGARTSILERLERSPLLLIRRGTWGLRTLIFMGYYARPEAGAAIGYRADARGWGARRG